jgi:hypothetical protein
VLGLHTSDGDEQVHRAVKGLLKRPSVGAGICHSFGEHDAALVLPFLSLK